MDKMKMQTNDIAHENFRKLAELFPNAVTETKDENGELVPAIDKDILMQEISAQVVEGNEERYQFTWPDKRNAIRLASTPVRAALRPCRRESVDFDNTENLYIEGDNLDVLKLLRETYLGKVKMIYIDPPYNTGNDFVYDDDFAESGEEWKAASGDYDNQGNRLFQNTDSNGRFHTDWLNMIYPRLKLAKDLLADDGVIFISIDDNEVENLKKICNEVFGAGNFVGAYIKQSKIGGGSDTKFIVKEHEYCLVYVKYLAFANEMFMKHEEDYLKRYKEQDEKGRFFWDTFARPGLKHPIVYDIIAPDGSVINNGWIHSKERFDKEYADGDVRIIRKNNEGWSVQFKQYLNENGKKPRSMTMPFGGSIDGKIDVGELFNNDKLFSYPKSVKFVSTLLETSISKTNLILDFFSGSSTTAHAVMQLNAEDGGNRKFIMVQLPELCDEKSEAYKAGYRNICEIGKERIRRAGRKIKEELAEKAAKIQVNLSALKEKIKDQTGLGLPAEEKLLEQQQQTETELAQFKQRLAKLDIGFKTLKLDSTNMEDVYYNPADTPKDILPGLISNIKPDRTPEDLLFQVMLELGVLLSSKIEETRIGGKKVFNVANNFLLACFDDNVTDEVVTAIAKQKPVYAVLRDSSFATDSVAANFEQLFATFSPDTVRRIL